MGGRAKLPDKGDPLTEREKQIMQLLSIGHDRLEVAELLQVKDSTVKTHLFHVYRKLGARSVGHALSILWRDEKWGDTRGSIKLDGILEVHLREWQLVELPPDNQRRVWVQITGWVTSRMLNVTKGGPIRTVLTEVNLPGRPCWSGQVAIMNVSKRGDVYGTGLYLELRWPKSGKLEMPRTTGSWKPGMVKKWQPGNEIVGSKSLPMTLSVDPIAPVKAGASGEHHSGAKLTLDEVRLIRRLRDEEGMSYEAITERLGGVVGRNAVYLVATRRRWAHVE